MSEALFTIEHKCKHKAVHDLTEVPPYDRKARAEWLATKRCTACWIESQKKRATTARIKVQDADALAAAVGRAKRFSLPALTGSEKQAAWAMRERDRMLGAVFQAGLQGAEFESLILSPARTITMGSWWITNRGLRPDELAAALEAAGALISREEHARQVREERGIDNDRG